MLGELALPAFSNLTHCLASDAGDVTLSAGAPAVSATLNVNVNFP